MIYPAVTVSVLRQIEDMRVRGILSQRPIVIATGKLDGRPVVFELELAHQRRAGDLRAPDAPADGHDIEPGSDQLWIGME